MFILGLKDKKTPTLSYASYDVTQWAKPLQLIPSAHIPSEPIGSNLSI